MAEVKILAIKLRAIGDTVIWTSALRTLREKYPQAEITVLTYSSNAHVLIGANYINKFYFLKGKSKFQLIKMLWQSRWWRYDWLLGFHATTSLCRWAWLAGAGRMVLHHHSWDHTPLGSVDIPNPGRLEDAISRDYQVLYAMSGDQNIKKLPTKIFVEQKESALAEAELIKRIQTMGGNPTKSRLAFLPGAGHFLRRYPKDLWLKVLKKVIADREFQPVVFADQALSREWQLKEECKKLKVPLFDEGTLRDFIVRVSRCHKALANDSGPGHIAVALGLKTTFIFGPGCAGDWHCYDPREHPLLRVEVDCRNEGPHDQEKFQYCTVNECSHHKCMRGVDVALL